MTAVVETVSKLEVELKELQKKRGDVEYRLRLLENKEKAQQGLLGKRNRGEGNFNQQNKRTRENNGEQFRRDDGRHQRDDFRSNFNNRGTNDRGDREREPREPLNKPGRLSSVVTGQRANPRDPPVSRVREEPKKPKLTSAIVSPSPIPVVGEKPRPSLDTTSEETRKRSKKLFGFVLNTLNTFKKEISQKSEAEQRREELEQKVQLKVKEEQETFKEEQKRALQELKEKELKNREDIRQQQEQKELELLNLRWDTHRSLLSAYLKTEAKPPIYYKPVKVDPDSVKNQKQNTPEDSEMKDKKKDNQDGAVGDDEEK